MASKKNGKGHHVPAAELIAVTSFLDRVPTVDLDAYEVAREVVALVPQELCRRLVVLPVSRVAGSLVVAMVDPTNRATLEVLAAHTGLAIEPVVATEASIVAAIGRYYP